MFINILTLNLLLKYPWHALEVVISFTFISNFNFNNNDKYREKKIITIIEQFRNISFSHFLYFILAVYIYNFNPLVLYIQSINLCLFSYMSVHNSVTPKPPQILTEEFSGTMEICFAGFKKLKRLTPIF